MKNLKILGWWGTVMLSVLSASAATDAFIPLGADWRYLDDGSDQGTAWIAPSFNDSAWSLGPAELGYGEGDEATVVYSGPSGDYFITTYFRHTFSVPDPGSYPVLRLRLIRDDGVVVYLNGTEVFRNNLPAGAIAFDTRASLASDDGKTFLLTTVNPGLLVTGNNVMAVEIHQESPGSSDISFNLELTGSTENGLPTVTLASPLNNAFFTEPANIMLTALASDPDGFVSRVEFFQGAAKLGEDTNSPFSFNWTNVPFGNYTLKAIATDNLNAKATSAVVNVTVAVSTPPIITNVSPAAGSVTNLNQITVRFSEPVSGVSAADLLVNGVPASAASGSNAVYTFSFPQPREGTVLIAWDARHGIADYENPPRAFDQYGASATWQYTYTDRVTPKVAVTDPVPGAVVSALSQVGISFTEPVWGVNAADLLINGTAATQVAGSGSGPYVFGFSQPPQGTVQLAWASGHGIRDFAATPNAFAGGNWTCTLNTNALFEGQVVINEIMYHPASQNLGEEYIELLNLGTAPVNLTGWRLTRGVEFTFTNRTLAAGGYLVVAAEAAAFSAKYPSVANVVGGWAGRLSNTEEDIELEDASGNRVDLVHYADEGDWAVRRRWPLDTRGWEWFAEHDGLGKSLELMNAALDNNNGENWTSSATAEGTPGQRNSVATNNVAPLIFDVAHSPAVPRSTNAVAITARIVDEQTTGLTVTLRSRDASTISPPPFSSKVMFDDGAHNDADAGDGIYGVILPPLSDRTVIEYYVQAVDAGGRVRTWPAAALEADGTPAQSANALYQVDDSTYTGTQPLYRVVLTETERALHAGLSRGSDAQMNVTFVTTEGNDVQVRHNGGLRFRGASSRSANPPTYRLNLPSDRKWNNVSALNLNSQYTHAQLIGAAFSALAGLPAAHARAVQLRVNGVNHAGSGSPQFGSYVHVEPLDAEWAQNHFPEDGNGNVYRCVKYPWNANLDHLGTDYTTYVTAGYSKTSNQSENDWTDLFNLTYALDPNYTADSDYMAALKRNVNVDLWLRYFVVCNLLVYRETALCLGVGDDYGMYRPLLEPRFMLLAHDFDTILGQGSPQGSASESIWVMLSPPTGDPAQSANFLPRFLQHPEIEPRYYAEFRRLLNTSFSTNQMSALIDQLLGDWVPVGTIEAMKTFVVNRTASVLTQLPAEPVLPRASITGEPPSPTYLRNVSLRVGGTDITHYRYRLNNGSFGTETPVSTPITLSNLSNGTFTIFVIGKNSTGVWQDQAAATVSRTWTVIASLANLVINEVLARNDTVLNHSNTFPDAIELYNPRATTVDLAGLRLTDDPANPNKFTFPAGTTLASGAYLVVFANDPDATPGFHAGFALEQNGEGVYLFDRATNGGAIVDSVVFGAQLPDLSIGRLASGNWGLTTPTFGSVNVARPVGNGSALHINEWLADGVFPYVDDFIELYNPDPLPVNLSGLYLTDNPIGRPTRHRIAPLHFVGPYGYQVFIADGNSGAGPDHVNFSLALERGEIALLAPDLTILDCITYAQQRIGVSQGRSPNGGSRIVYFDQPTPGAGNPTAPEPVAPLRVNLIPIDDAFLWRYDDSGADLGTEWRNPSFNDSAWATGPALLAVEDCNCLPEPIRTPLTITSGGRMTFYFRAQFNIPADLNMSALEMRHVIDDGAVFYINGREAGRFNMPGGIVTNQTPATTVGNAVYQGPFALPITNVAPGLNVLAVEVHQPNTSSSDLVFGLRLDALVYTNSPTAAGVVLNELLANNNSITNADGSTPDWVELYNPANAGVDLAGMSLARQPQTNSGAADRWVFPPGSVIPAHGYYRVLCDGSTPPSAGNTGFSLDAAGDAVYFYDRATNGGSMLDGITFGIQATDWSLGRFPNGGTNWTLTQPTPLAANIGVTLGDARGLKINEWLASPATGDDWFEVYNSSAQPVELSHLHLRDDANDYEIPPRSFLAAGLLGFKRFHADRDTGAGADHTNFRLSASGDALTILSAIGEQIDSLTFGAQAIGVSEGRLPDGDTNIVAFPDSATPGDSNFLPIPSVLINEVMSHTDSPFEDAIELFNPGDAAVNISGWYLSDAKNFLKKYRIPNSTSIGARSFKVFYEYQFNPIPGYPTSFGLSSVNGDEVYLSAADSSDKLTGFRAVVKFGAAERGVSFGRYQSSVGPQFVPMSARTFGVDNPDTLQQFRTGTGKTNSYPKIGPVVISEIMYHPPDIGGTTDNVADEYIQLRNISGASVPLFDPAYPTNHWRLRDAVKFDFPANVTLPASGTLLVVSFNPATQPATLAAFRTNYNLSTNALIFGPYEGKLDNSTDSVELYKPDAPQAPGTPDAGYVPHLLVERVTYSDTPPWPPAADGTGASLQRVDPNLFGNDPVNWIASAPLNGPADSDGDGMPDAWETQYGLNPASAADALLDPDGDGMTNLDEYLAGTNPTNPASDLRFQLTIITAGTLELSFVAAPNKSYTVEVRNNFDSGAWLPVFNVDPQPTEQVVRLTDSTAGVTRFYRVRSPRLP